MYRASLPICKTQARSAQVIQKRRNKDTTEETYRDANTVDTKITKTKNAGAISDDADLGVLAGPVLQNGADGLALLDGDVESLGAGVDGGVLQADITNGRCVDEGHELADVVHDEAVEEVDVLSLEAGQVQVLVDGCLTAVDHLHRSGALGLEALHDVGDEASQVLADTLLGSERQAYTVSWLLVIVLPYRIE